MERRGRRHTCLLAEVGHRSRGNRPPAVEDEHAGGERLGVGHLVDRHEQADVTRRRLSQKVDDVEELERVEDAGRLVEEKKRLRRGKCLEQQGATALPPGQRTESSLAETPELEPRFQRANPGVVACGSTDDGADARFQGGLGLAREVAKPSCPVRQARERAAAGAVGLVLRGI